MAPSKPDATMTPEPQTYAVDPARLRAGDWCHRSQKTVGQGDIAASYSAERIGMTQPIRKPFDWKGALWVCVGITFRNGTQAAEAYRLIHPQLFDGDPLIYAAKTSDGDAARSWSSFRISVSTLTSSITAELPEAMALISA